MQGWTFKGIQRWVSLLDMFGGQQVCFYVFYIYLSIYVFMCFYGDIDIILATLVDVVEVGHPMVRLHSHGPLRRPRGGRGELVRDHAQP